ncbi:MAG: hypothetical protein COU28_04310 [Candidatus Magasanikbacteria bacterium CG10_big_fil_rev_8_21_14_0_10_36_16]|uniref:Uncharacterized protein n=1 Tax=Candidatus Magasanikbacteria bacterium CG10_big_fil_rev_8_21_14_0_10_36_16 TaxID=1974645 RepID=A0A2H0TZD2_9BACT|nr:MAG: hypothetical protein COU28_04310 [Candidatus Magasanikbacteria bacterium CG10_big_fil_rev_8_21_14_0_10_36_16]
MSEKESIPIYESKTIDGKAVIRICTGYDRRGRPTYEERPAEPGEIEVLNRAGTSFEIVLRNKNGSSIDLKA